MPLLQLLQEQQSVKERYARANAELGRRRNMHAYSSPISHERNGGDGVCDIREEVDEYGEPIADPNFSSSPPCGSSVPAPPEHGESGADAAVRGFKGWFSESRLAELRALEEASEASRADVAPHRTAADKPESHKGNAGSSASAQPRHAFSLRVPERGDTVCANVDATESGSVGSRCKDAPSTPAGEHGDVNVSVGDGGGVGGNRVGLQSRDAFSGRVAEHSNGSSNAGVMPRGRKQSAFLRDRRSNHATRL